MKYSGFPNNEEIEVADDIVASIERAAHDMENCFKKLPKAPKGFQWGVGADNKLHVYSEGTSEYEEE